MIRTYKVKHNIEKARIDQILQASQRVASFVVNESKLGKKLTSKHVKQFGLHSHISNSIIKKYANNKKLKELKLKNVKASFFLDNKKFDEKTKVLKLNPIKTSVKIWFPTENVIKWNYVELNKEFAHVVVTLKDVPQIDYDNSIGIDLNATSYSIVVASTKSGKVLKLCREIPHLKKKYRELRRQLQKKSDKRQLVKQSRREHRKTIDVVNKSVKRIVEFAKKENASIKLEDLKGIRKRCSRKNCSELNHTINSWPFFMLKTKLSHKALQYGIKIDLIDPRFTSQKCSRCGHISRENRKGKKFVCALCAHVDHADVNAAFNIAVASVKINSSAVKKKAVKKSDEEAKEVFHTSNAVSSKVNDKGCVYSFAELETSLFKK